MAEKDKRPYFVLTNEYPRHRKIRPLSDKAFRLHVTLLGLCNEERNDGLIQEHDLRMLGKKPGDELLTAGLLQKTYDGRYQLHDYTRHQKTAEEIARHQAESHEAKQQAGAAGGRKSAHTRWHVKRGVFDPNCELCADLRDEESG